MEETHVVADNKKKRISKVQRMLLEKIEMAEKMIECVDDEDGSAKNFFDVIKTYIRFNERSGYSIRVAIGNYYGRNDFGCFLNTKIDDLIVGLDCHSYNSEYEKIALLDSPIILFNSFDRRNIFVLDFSKINRVITNHNKIDIEKGCFDFTIIGKKDTDFRLLLYK